MIAPGLQRSNPTCLATGVAVRTGVAAVLLYGLVWLPAQAEKRVALVIGNSAYQHTPKLANPNNDVALVAVLMELCFQVIEGHGVQVAGESYLVPTDAELASEAALDFEMVRLDLVQRTMERDAKVNILFLDACRDNPLAHNLASAMGTCSNAIARGLAAAELGVGTFISFSTQPGNVALDGSGRKSPFTEALVKPVKSAELVQATSAIASAPERANGTSSTTTVMSRMDWSSFIRNKMVCTLCIARSC